MKRAALVALAVALGACARPPRIVPPLRYDVVVAPPADEPFRAKPPQVAVDAPSPPPASQTFALRDGVRVIVVPRPGHGTIAARLAFARDAVDMGESSELLPLIAPVFLAGDDGGDDDASASCDENGCTIAARGADGDLAHPLDAIAARLASTHGADTAYAQRLGETNRTRPTMENAAGFAFQRNVDFALLAGSPFVPPPEDLERPIALAELAQARDAVLVPSLATLVVVGDVTIDAVRAEAERRFASWRPREASRANAQRPALPPLRSAPRVVLVEQRSLQQMHAAIVARGPARDDPDFDAFAVTVRALGASYTSAAQAVREELAGAYSTGAFLDEDRQGSIAHVGGSFDADKAVASAAKILGALRELRASGPGPEPLAHAKASAIAALRETWSTNAGVARAIATRTQLGLAADDRDRPQRLAAVTAADVQRVARRWLGEESLRAVFVGDVRFLRGDVPQLRMGDWIARDGFGRAR